MITTTKRSMDYLRKQGYSVWIVEQTVRMPDRSKPGQWTMFKRDCFNMFDILAIGHGDIIGIQTTTRSNQAARISKIRENEYALKWAKAGGKIVVHGWKKMAHSNKWEVCETQPRIDEL